MAFDYQEKKPLLYADLFKPLNKTALQTDINPQHKIISSSINNTNHTAGSLFGSSSSLNRLSSFCDSSSSGFSTPFESELGSSESEEDGDFIAELSREMAECMLQDDDDDNYSVSDDSEGLVSPVKNSKELPYVESSAIKFAGLYPGPGHTEGAPTLQGYQLKNQNQPPILKNPGTILPSGRFSNTDPAQPKNVVMQEKPPYMQYRARNWGAGKGGVKLQNGSGMQAVFLGGAGSKNGSSGTGVFLPRVTNDPAELKKKSGCSTVLIPTRVLQALEQHFNGRTSTGVPPLNSRCAPSSHSYPKDESNGAKGQRNGQTEFQNQPTSHEDQEILLPQEWTY